MQDFFWFRSPPPRDFWSDFCAAVCQDEEPDLEPAENVLDDLILFEVGYERSELTVHNPVDVIRPPPVLW